MKKMLGIVGSPRRNGNTHFLVNAVLEGARNVGWETEIVLLGDLKISECDGCHACWRGKPCGKRDDMNKIYPLIKESSALVFGTPVYWYGPTALMKAFIDRLVYFNCAATRPGIKGKPAALAVPFEEANHKTAALVEAFFEKCLEYLEMDYAGIVLAPGVTLKGEIRKKAVLLEEARVLGVKLARRVNVVP